ncbi:non-ribosomal peptide synthetase [Legionella nagasakiensis]|uniref:non-ribosomal peptide synthetase n=1 Tax=Legionella nagasakiensis TaxID=535290 RepID=UPI001055948E|nr:AMP-binding protein [Legionella nagasakiensis]
MQTNLYLQFEQQAKQTPNSPCLSNGDVQLTYQGALTKIMVISQHLHANGVQAGQVVALYCEKNIEAILCFLAIARIGATTLTLDTAFPPNMIAFILTDANVRWIISSQSFPFDSKLPLLTLSQLTSSPEQTHPSQADFLAKKLPPATSIAWIVYSSGTTGNPKGIAISHQAILSSIFSRYTFSDYQQNDKVACSIYFFWEVFRPLFRGACAYVVPDALLLNVRQYILFIGQQAITETLWTPSFAQMLFQCLSEDELVQLSSLKRVWLNGEVVCRQLAEDALNKLAHVHFFNLYSISETFDVSAMPLAKQKISQDGFASIGYALPGVKTWVLDNNQQVCSSNQVGELYISSPFLAEGYLNRDDLQQQSFLTLDNLGDGQRLFKTKDTAYQNEAGEIFLLGRNDHIIKLRGYNVSLLAIEDVIKRALPVHQCVVTVEGNNPINQIIVAAIQAQDAIKFIDIYALEVASGLSSKLQTILSDFLPHYAIPTKFFLVDTIQWNRYSAKLDRKNILPVTSGKKNAEPIKAGLTMPVTHLNEIPNSNAALLKQLWHEILLIPVILIHEESDFFAFGANSLQAIQYVQRLNQQFGLNVEPATVYQQSSFAAQLHWLAGNTVQQETLAETILEDIQVTFKQPAKPCQYHDLSLAQQVLITGTTGFLGAHWLASCLSNTNCTYYCLVRADNKQTGLERLKQAFKQYHLDDSLLNKRVVVLNGSLTQPKLGLPDKDWMFLTEHMDLILHAAATVNLLYPYTTLKASMIDGTKTLLSLATTHRLKPFVLISSDAVFAKQQTYDSHNFLSKESIHDLTYGYAQAKWAQEQLVKKAALDCQLPYLVVRLGNLSSSLTSGVGNKNDANCMLMRFIKKLKIIPSQLSLELTPVDKIANYLTKRCLTKITNHVCSLTDFNVVDARNIRSLLAEYSLHMISPAQWLEALQLHDPTLYTLWQLDNLFSAKYYTFVPTPERKELTQWFTLTQDELQCALYLLDGSIPTPSTTYEESL